MFSVYSLILFTCSLILSSHPPPPPMLLLGVNRALRGLRSVSDETAMTDLHALGHPCRSAREAHGAHVVHRINLNVQFRQNVVVFEELAERSESCHRISENENLLRRNISNCVVKREVLHPLIFSQLANYFVIILKVVVNKSQPAPLFYVKFRSVNL